MKRKIIKGWTIPTIKSVSDELKWLRDEWHPSNRKDLAIEITKDGEVYGGFKPSIGSCASGYVAGRSGGRVCETIYWGTASDYALTKEAKSIIDYHIWIIENFE